MAPPSLSFTQSRVPVGKFFLLSLLSIALLALDRRFEAVQQVRNIAATATFPLQWLATQPVAFYHYSRDLAQSQTALQAQNRRLNAENIRLQAEVNQNTALQKDVNELKAILGLQQETSNGSVAAAVVSSGRDPSSSLLVIDKGSVNGVYEGQPVISDKGVVGQVVAVAAKQQLAGRDARACAVDAAAVLPAHGARAGGGPDLRLCVFYLAFIGELVPVEDADVVAGGQPGVGQVEVGAAGVLAVEGLAVLGLA